ncbi:MAG: hypothetical protein JXR76_13530, partial [Deltaproteobacteria bacterium]|nr:hypothetical protein [Deltaproteobacteria bacterium]
MMNTHYRGAVMVSWIVLCIAFSVCQVMAGDFVPGQVVVRFKNDVSIEKSDQGVRFNLPELDQLNQDYKLEA